MYEDFYKSLNKLVLKWKHMYPEYLISSNVDEIPIQYYLLLNNGRIGFLYESIFSPVWRFQELDNLDFMNREKK